MTSTFHTDFWGPTQSTIEFIASDTHPDLPLTAVNGLLIKDNKVLLTKVKRGWDVPSGHIEEGETPEEALIREVVEETGATLGEFSVLGHMKLTKTVENNENKKYPYLSAVPVFVSTDFVLPGIYTPKFESEMSELVSIFDIHKYHHHWSPMWEDILKYARVKVK